MRLEAAITMIECVKETAGNTTVKYAEYSDNSMVTDDEFNKAMEAIGTATTDIIVAYERMMQAMQKIENWYK